MKICDHCNEGDYCGLKFIRYGKLHKFFAYMLICVNCEPKLKQQYAEEFKEIKHFSGIEPIYSKGKRTGEKSNRLYVTNSGMRKGYFNG